MSISPLHTPTNATCDFIVPRTLLPRGRNECSKIGVMNHSYFWSGLKEKDSCLSGQKVTVIDCSYFLSLIPPLNWSWRKRVRGTMKSCVALACVGICSVVWWWAGGAEREGEESSVIRAQKSFGPLKVSTPFLHHFHPALQRRECSYRAARPPAYSDTVAKVPLYLQIVTLSRGFYFWLFMAWELPKLSL